jgi:D-alanyl-D-alanine carboxypeptidase (penicillin-binding protein 5/6)
MGAAQATESRSAILDGMEVEATAAILVDTTYGSLDVLYDQNSHERRYPASITKVMTALLTVEAVDNGQLSLDDWITVGPEVNHEVGSGSSHQNIKEGRSCGWRTYSTAPSPPPPTRRATCWPRRWRAAWPTLWT